MPARDMSAFPVVIAGIMESKSISSTSSFLPIASAIACAISISIPLYSSPSTYSYGGNVALVAITNVSLSDVFVVSAAALPSFASELLLSVLPHAAMESTIAAAATRATIFFAFIFFLLYTILSEMFTSVYYSCNEKRMQWLLCIKITYLCIFFQSFLILSVFLRLKIYVYAFFMHLL